MKPHNNITKYSRTLDVLFYNTNLSKLKGFLCEDILVEDQISSDLSWKSSITFLFKLNSQNGSLTNSFAFEKFSESNFGYIKSLHTDIAHKTPNLCYFQSLHYKTMSTTGFYCY